MTQFKKINLGEQVATVLRENPGTRLTGREIAKLILKRFPDQSNAKREASEQTFDRTNPFEAQISAEISSAVKRVHKKYSQIKVLEGRPRQYYWSDQTEAEEVDKNVSSKPEPGAIPGQGTEYLEKDLYEPLAKFVLSEFSCHCMRIDETRSRNTNGAGGNHWLFPDLVGLADLWDGLSGDVKSLASFARGPQAEVFSFEVKKKINRSNAREVFFQTVSNSSWANFAYLAAREIDERAIDELRMLCSAHDVGLIKIDFDAPEDSQVLIPAPRRLDLDLSLLDRLADQNEDARDFVQAVDALLKTQRMPPENWLFKER